MLRGTAVGVQNNTSGDLAFDWDQEATSLPGAMASVTVTEPVPVPLLSPPALAALAVVLAALGALFVRRVRIRA
jgi:hypothetical protein